MIAWRRDIHQHPELGNREFRTAALVAAHLESLGLEVRKEVAHTGIVAVLRGDLPGPVVALRADMDALPVEEKTGLPFASKRRSEFNGQEVGVMHACGHDAHTAILMGAAQALTGLKQHLAGTVVFIFQPAEEGAPAGEEGGAALMLAQGVFDNPAPEAVFGLHVGPADFGTLSYGAGPMMAASDSFRITVSGRQTHGALPWHGVDSVTTAAQIVMGLQTVVSRRLDITIAPAVISIGSIHGGIRNNIIPASVELEGTIRTFTAEHRLQVHRDIQTTARGIAQSAGAEVEVIIDQGYPATVNDAGLLDKMLPTLERVAPRFIGKTSFTTGSEDFSFFANTVPGLFISLGISPPGQDPEKTPPNHSPYFNVDEGALVVGVEALTALAFDYLRMQASQ